MRKQSVMLVVAALGIGSVLAGGDVRWLQTEVDTDRVPLGATTLAASGLARGGETVTVTFAAHENQDLFLVKGAYVRGGRTLGVDQAYRRNGALSVLEATYVTRTERLGITLVSDSVSGASEISYALPDGESIQLEFQADGTFSAVELVRLRQAAKRFTDLWQTLDLYWGDLATLPAPLSRPGDLLIAGPILAVAPVDATMVSRAISICRRECTSECGHENCGNCYPGDGLGCAICWITCDIGCGIGCGSSAE